MPPRVAKQYSIYDRFGEADKPSPIGLAENPPGVPFQCGTCSFLAGNIDGLVDTDIGPDLCTNEDARLYMEHVEERWCCDRYNHPGMRVIKP